MKLLKPSLVPSIPRLYLICRKTCLSKPNIKSLCRNASFSRVLKASEVILTSILFKQPTVKKLEAFWWDENLFNSRSYLSRTERYLKCIFLSLRCYNATIMICRGFTSGVFNNCPKLRNILVIFPLTVFFIVRETLCSSFLMRGFAFGKGYHL